MFFRTAEEKQPPFFLIAGCKAAGTTTVIQYLQGTEFIRKRDARTKLYSLEKKEEEKKEDANHLAAKKNPCIVNGKEFSYIDYSLDYYDSLADDKNKSLRALLSSQDGLMNHPAKGVLIVIPWYHFYDGNFESLIKIIQFIEKLRLSHLAHLKTEEIFIAISRPPEPELDEVFNPDLIKQGLTNQLQALLDSLAKNTHSGEPFKSDLKNSVQFVQNALNNVFVIRGFKLNENDMDDHKQALLEKLRKLKRSELNAQLLQQQPVSQLKMRRNSI